MLKEDFNNGTASNQEANAYEANSQAAGQPQLAELEKKYEKELNEYEQKTHFMEDHSLDFGEAESPSEITEESTQKYDFSSQENTDTEEEQVNEPAASSPISASELIENGIEMAKIKAAEVWDNVKSEWKHDRKDFVRKTLVGTAVTGAAIGLILLTRKKKKTGLIEGVLKAA